MEDLLSALSDYLLQSGFQQQYMDFYDLNDAEQTLDDLRQAIAEALLNSDMLDEQMREQIENMSAEQMEAPDRAADRAHGAGKLHQRRSAARSLAQLDRRRAGRRRAIAGALRDHRQGPRLPRLSRAARSAGLAGQVELRPPRHARQGHRHRGQRRVEDLRIRRHAEPRHHRDVVERDSARRPAPAAEHRVQRSAGASVRIPVVVRDRAACSTARTP